MYIVAGGEAGGPHGQWPSPGSTVSRHPPCDAVTPRLQPVSLGPNCRTASPSAWPGLERSGRAASPTRGQAQEQAKICGVRDAMLSSLGCLR